MRQICKGLAAAALSLASLTTPVLADEAWNTNFGRMIWLETRGPDAIFALEAEGGGATMHLMVPGLGDDMMGGRGAYTGIWVAPEGEYPCVTEMVDPVGGKSRYWGSFTITFVEDDFPSDFAGVYGECLDIPAFPIQAHAIVGGQ